MEMNTQIQVTIDQMNIPPEIRNNYETMQDITISLNGIIKLLQGLKPDKAPGPDRIKPLLFQKLCLESAPIRQVLFYMHLKEGSLPSDLLKANVSSIFNKGDKSSLLTTGP